MTQLPELKLSAERIANLRKWGRSTFNWGEVEPMLDDIATLSSAYRELAVENERLRQELSDHPAKHFGDAVQRSYDSTLTSLKHELQEALLRADQAEQALARAGEVTEEMVDDADAAWCDHHSPGTLESMRAALTAALAVKGDDG